MKAVILAAGRGSRLKSLTQDKPKCLNILNKRTLLDWQLATLKKKVDDIYLVKGYLSELFINKKIKYIDNSNWAETNMIESLYIFLKQTEFSDVIITYGDIVYNEEILSKLIDSKHDVVIPYDKNWYELWNRRFKDPLEDAESFIVDDKSWLVSLGKKRPSYDEIQGQYMGIIKITKRGFEIIFENLLKMNKNKRKKIDVTTFLNNLLKKQKIFTIPIFGNWMEFDTPSDFELAKKLISEKKLKLTTID